MLTLVLAESALELVPPELKSHNAIIASAKRLNKKPTEILLDVSWHFAAMKGIRNEIKRGRPDLVHLCLLEVCSIPLFFKNQVQVFVHTIDNKVISVGSGTRLPKSYHRFAGLIEKLYSVGKIEEKNHMLLEIKKMSFGELMKSIKPEKIIGLSRNGHQSSYQAVAKGLDSKSCIVIGGFAKGKFSDHISKQFDETVSIDKNGLEAHVVISRLLYEYEKRIIMHL